MNVAVPLPSRNIHTFTPVRRRESTINSRPLYTEQEKEWTAARCHRLLRALTSRVAILKKDLSKLQSANHGEAKPAVYIGRQTVDTDWNKAKKRIKQTYSKRGGRIGIGTEASKGLSRGPASKEGRKSILPGEITVPTPILARARGEHHPVLPTSLQSSGVTQADSFKGNKRLRARCNATDGDSSFQPTETLRALRQKTAAARYTTYEGVYNGLEALLRATVNDGAEPLRQKGARSLMSMALRAVPNYITQQEDLLEAHMEETGSKSVEKRDISTEIYDELESFGSCGHGWKGLKVIVRAHGVQVICEAIYLGLFDDAFCEVLVGLCINACAMNEAQSILSALLSSNQYPSPKALYDLPAPPLAMLWKFTNFSGQTSFLYRELSSILSSGLLPIAWLATKEFGPILGRTIQHLSPEIMNDDALLFLDNALSLLLCSGAINRAGASMTGSTAVTEAVKNTLSSLLTTISSIVMLSKEAGGKSPHGGSQPGQKYDHINKLLQSCLVSDMSSSDSSSSVVPLLAYLIAQHNPGTITEGEEHLADALRAQLPSKTIPRSSPVFAQAAAFICLVARCCGRGASNSGFEYLQKLHNLLESWIATDNENICFGGLIAQSAFVFAQKVPDEEHSDYAKAMDAKYPAKTVDHDVSILDGPEDGYVDDSSGFRWEEGIGEWVTATPAAHNTKHKAVAMKSFEDDFKCDTPYQAPHKLRRKTKQPDPDVQSTPLVSSPDFDDSAMSFQMLYESPSRLVAEEPLDDAMSDEDSTGSPVYTATPDDLRTACSRSSTPEFRDELEDSEPFSFEKSFAEDSSLSYGSSTSLASTRSDSRQAIDLVPRLSRKLFRKSHDWQMFEDSFSSTTSSVVSSQSNESTAALREYVDRAPRLGKRALRASQAFQLFDESDDELSFISASSQESRGPALQDVTKTGTGNSRPIRQVKPLGKLSKTKTTKVVVLSDSEDELGI